MIIEQRDTLFIMGVLVSKDFTDAEKLELIGITIGVLDPLEVYGNLDETDNLD